MQTKIELHKDNEVYKQHEAEILALAHKVAAITDELRQLVNDRVLESPTIACSTVNKIIRKLYGTPERDLALDVKRLKGIIREKLPILPHVAPVATTGNTLERKRRNISYYFNKLRSDGKLTVRVVDSILKYMRIEFADGFTLAQGLFTLKELLEEAQKADPDGHFDFSYLPPDILERIVEFAPTLDQRSTTTIICSLPMLNVHELPQELFDRLLSPEISAELADPALFRIRKLVIRRMAKYRNTRELLSSAGNQTDGRARNFTTELQQYINRVQPL